MAGEPNWEERYDRSLAQERDANITALRAWSSQPLLPFLLKHLLIGLVIGLFGWLVVNWVWGLITFLICAGVGPVVRMYALRRHGKA